MYAYGLNNPLLFVDPFGSVITPANVVGALIGAGLGALVGTAIANHFGLTGWARAAAIGGGALLTGIVGWFAGPAILSVISKTVMSAISAGKLALTSLSTSIIKVLDLGHKAAQNTINHINEFLVSNKHLMNAGGGYSKFATNSKDQVNRWIQEALTNATQYQINSKDSFQVIVDVGHVIGTEGQQKIRVCFTLAGKIITAYPMK